jgi:hypothetical protein
MVTRTLVATARRKPSGIASNEVAPDQLVLYNHAFLQVSNKANPEPNAQYPKLVFRFPAKLAYNNHG